jgi:hypothetical protein
MKTLKKINPKTSEFDYKRTDDKTADYAVKNQGWSFCPKSEWKTNVRDLGKVENSSVQGEIYNTDKKSSKKHAKTNAKV